MQDDDPNLSQPSYARLIGTRIVRLSKDGATAELPVTPDVANPNGVLHGGVLMAMADNLGGRSTMANLPPGARTTTIESKTNFFAAIPVGEIAYAECTALHKGRTTMVWQTRITRVDGKLAALVTQTQMVIMPERKPQ
jgi:1,4-dihydroxy-2-naphthoyl-CoA hydrolase